MSPDASRFTVLLEQCRRVSRLRGIADGVLAGAGAAGLVVGVASLASVSAPQSRVWALGVFGVAAVAIGVRGWRLMTPRHVAALLEARRPASDNTIVTAEEVLSGRTRPLHAVVSRELFAAAVHGLEEIMPAVAGPLKRHALLAIASVVAVAILGAMLPATLPESERAVGNGRSRPEESLASRDVRVVVTPPAYTRRQATASLNPTALDVLEGSVLRFEAAREAGPLVLVTLSASAPFALRKDRLVAELAATTSQPIVIRRENGDGVDRLISVRVSPDQRPVVRIERPAKDLAFPDATGTVAIHIDARDDVGLAAVKLRYTRMSGSGETFTFEEGEWPVELSRDGTEHWTARATFSLEGLKLQDGDTLVYRAVAADGKPGADPSTSDTFLIEVGRLAAIAATGFALPEDRDRQALSQQMLIIKTERLEAERRQLETDTLLEKSRLLAVEQRMVKAEFVFMTGGEVADEVEEATNAHELAEGRQENTAQAELLTAIREMARAEARLNDGNTTEALQFERAALKALQRAFDRRRYLLRTLPERTRIDLSRRLTGEIAAAHSSAHDRRPMPADPVSERARALLQELRASAPGSNAASLAARLIALDPSSERLQRAALQLSLARDRAALEPAIGEAEQAVLDVLTSRLAPARPARITRESLRGQLGAELRRGAR